VNVLIVVKEKANAPTSGMEVSTVFVTEHGEPFADR
jgi:hypothetical protein